MSSTSELCSPLGFTCSEGSTGIGPTTTPPAMRLCAVVFVARPPSQLPNPLRNDEDRVCARSPQAPCIARSRIGIRDDQRLR